MLFENNISHKQSSKTLGKLFELLNDKGGTALSHKVSHEMSHQGEDLEKIKEQKKEELTSLEDRKIQNKIQYEIQAYFNNDQPHKLLNLISESGIDSVD